MKQFETGRTLIETLGVLAFIGILTVSGLSLYAKAMNTIRANYIMEQVFIRANQLAQSPVANRHRMADAFVQAENNNQLAYGFEFTGPGELEERETKITVGLRGNFPETLCKILRKKVDTQEYPGLRDLQGADNCDGGDIDISFVINSNFKSTKKLKEKTPEVQRRYNEVRNGYIGQRRPENDDCNIQGALACDPLVCDEANKWYEFEDAPGHCERCPAGYYCETE